ncbi:hypothetical protein GGI13_005633 [Coemansia sp. RSA 455]|nr:hypothetical protein GGI14_000857 [Coemansia sp. S680]KAJ2036011.1 hypothetical protein H4S04_008859 [Coemansia sp. S16]KAJ2245957.1 hypothetical protein GGI13_005633 [Coemansia sp. RSA 455]KAJ2437364.1 hypothetical protein GGI03_009268 [Coemansia sp. RSA 2337]
MGTVDICQSSPYFRVKRGTLTLFIGTKATSSIHSVKLKVLAALKDHYNDSAFNGLTAGHIRLLARQESVATGTSDLNRTLEPDTMKIRDAELVDDQALYLTLKRADGTWEEPFVADYDADTQEMDVV